MNTVTSPNWSVSATTGALPKGQAVLNVSRRYKTADGRELRQDGDLNGTVWSNSDAAFQAAYERGYTMDYVQQWCPTCRCLHRAKAYKVGELLQGKWNTKARPSYMKIGRRGWSALFSQLAHWKDECKQNIRENDLANLEALEARLKALTLSGGEELREAWEAVEKIKNRYNGRPPRKAVAA